MLDVPPGIAPAELPTEGLLDELAEDKALRSATFTAVGYGMVREEKTGWPHGILPIDGVRRFALETFRSLQPAWLSLSTGDAGTCFGDSGGPHFLGGETSNLLVSITVIRAQRYPMRNSNATAMRLAQRIAACGSSMNKNGTDGAACSRCAARR